MEWQRLQPRIVMTLVRTALELFRLTRIQILRVQIISNTRKVHLIVKKSPILMATQLHIKVRLPSDLVTTSD